jgi:hypothetical protein
MKENSFPPRLAQKLFDWFCSDATVEDLRGDMDELFYVNLTRMPARKAKLKYWIHTIFINHIVCREKTETTNIQTSVIN